LILKTIPTPNVPMNIVEVSIQLVIRKMYRGLEVTLTLVLKLHVSLLIRAEPCTRIWEGVCKIGAYEVAQDFVFPLDKWSRARIF
jgi:hypothetical protein